MLSAVNSVDRSIPESLIPKKRELAFEAYVALRTGSFIEAERIYDKIYQMLFVRQAQENRPIHKGFTLHMKGNATLLQRGRLEDSVRNFLLAYIEDVFNVPLGKEEEADGAPACKTLQEIFGMENESLNIIKKLAYEKKEQGLWNDIRDPEEILDEFMRRRKPKRGQLLSLCANRPQVRVRHSISRIPGEWERRVFIGGNYDNMLALRQIEAIVQELGYQPILPFDFDIPEDQIRHHDLVLLHNCKYAIFEVTLGNGHLMEIERAKDYENKVILVYNVRDERRQPPPTISSMLRTADYPMHPYLDQNELRQVISRFLQGGTLRK